MNEIPPEILLEYLRTEKTGSLRYSPRDISGVLKQISEKGDTDMFKQIINAYVSFCVDYWQARDPSFDAKSGALENMACASVLADLDLNLPKTSEEHPYKMFTNPDKHGAAIKMFLNCLGLTGPILAERLLRPHSNN